MKLDVEKINYFKSLCKGYNYFKRQITYLQERLIQINTLLERIPKPGLSSEGGSSLNPIELMEEEEQVKRELEIFIHHVQKVDFVLGKLKKKDKEAIQRVYINKERYADVCMKCFYSERYLKRRIDLLIQKNFNF